MICVTEKKSQFILKILYSNNKANGYFWRGNLSGQNKTPHNKQRISQTSETGLSGHHQKYRNLQVLVGTDFISS